MSKGEKVKRKELLFFVFFLLTLSLYGCLAYQTRTITVDQSNLVPPGEIVNIYLSGFPRDQWITVKFGTNDAYSFTEVYINEDGRGLTWHTYPCGFSGQITAVTYNNRKPVEGPVIETDPCDNQSEKSS